MAKKKWANWMDDVVLGGGKSVKKSRKRKGKWGGIEDSLGLRETQRKNRFE